RAVSVLRERYGMDDASPFSYVSGLSPFLNVYCEPPQYLDAEERRVFEPVAFFGSLPPLEELVRHGERDGPSVFGGESQTLNVYVSFGTVAWRYYRDEAIDALRALSKSLAAKPDVRAVISLGRADLPPDVVQDLARPTVAVRPYLDQWQALGEAQVFVTHHGMTSTHEAVFHLVPMISYPFFWDQPSLANKCEELGVSVPLTTAPLAPVSEEDVDAALDTLTKRRQDMCARLTAAREWELQVVAERDA